MKIMLNYADNANVKALVPLFKTRSALTYYNAINDNLFELATFVTGKKSIKQAIQNLCSLKDHLFALHGLIEATPTDNTPTQVRDILDEIGGIEPPVQQANRLQEFCRAVVKSQPKTEEKSELEQTLTALSNAFFRLHLFTNDVEMENYRLIQD